MLFDLIFYVRGAPRSGECCSPQAERTGAGLHVPPQTHPATGAAGRLPNPSPLRPTTLCRNEAHPAPPLRRRCGAGMASSSWRAMACRRLLVALPSHVWDANRWRRGAWRCTSMMPAPCAALWRGWWLRPLQSLSPVVEEVQLDWPLQVPAQVPSLHASLLLSRKELKRLTRPA